MEFVQLTSGAASHARAPAGVKRIPTACSPGDGASRRAVVICPTTMTLGLGPRVADATRSGTEMNDDFDPAIREDGLGQRVIAAFQFPEAMDVSREIG